MLINELKTQINTMSVELKKDISCANYEVIMNGMAYYFHSKDDVIKFQKFLEKSVKIIEEEI